VVRRLSTGMTSDTSILEEGSVPWPIRWRSIYPTRSRATAGPQGPEDPEGPEGPDAEWRCRHASRDGEDAIATAQGCTVAMLTRACSRCQRNAIKTRRPCRRLDA
jgi:hypothetical protein